jgi:hypothetical protein
MEYLILALVIILILILLNRVSANETFKVEPSQGNKSYVKLYKDFNQKGHAFEVTGPNIFKQVMSMNPKSLDVQLSAIGAPADKIRRIEIWEMNPNMPNASLATDFYNIYYEADYNHRAHEGTFRQKYGDYRHPFDLLPYYRIGAAPLLVVKPGQRITGNLPGPVKKIMLIAVL